MCGRFALDTNPQRFADHFSISGDLDLIPSWNIAPSTKIHTITLKDSNRYLRRMKWGLVPASGFFEWKTENGNKSPWYISLKSGDPMAFAGLWEFNDKGSEPLETCCIITTSANSLMEPIHDRMPVILSPDQWELWLSPHEHQKEDLLPLIKPFDSKPMQAWEVSREVNKVGLRNDAGLIENIQ